MNLIRRSSGLLACLLGLVGVITCLAACMAVWMTRTRADQVATEFFNRAETAIGQIDQRSQETIQHIENTRDATGQMRENVRSRILDAAHDRATDALGLEELRQELTSRVQRAKDWIAFIRSTMDLVEQLLGIVDSAAMVDLASTTREELVATIQVAHQEVEQASELMDEVHERVVKIREGTDVQQNSERVREVLSRIDTALIDLQKRVAQFQTGLADVRREVTDLERKTRGWTLVAAVVLTFLFAWFGIAQFSLAIHGWKLLRTQTQS